MRRILLVLFWVLEVMGGAGANPSVALRRPYSSPMSFRPYFSCSSGTHSGCT